jgi:hypothetical protein
MVERQDPGCERLKLRWLRVGACVLPWLLVAIGVAREYRHWWSRRVLVSEIRQGLGSLATGVRDAEVLGGTYPYQCVSVTSDILEPGNPQKCLYVRVGSRYIVFVDCTVGDATPNSVTILRDGKRLFGGVRQSSAPAFRSAYWNCPSWGPNAGWELVDDTLSGRFTRRISTTAPTRAEALP